MDQRASYQQIPNLKLGKNHASKRSTQNRNEEKRAASRSEIKTLETIIDGLNKSKSLKSDIVLEATLTDCYRKLRNLIRSRLDV